MSALRGSSRARGRSRGANRGRRGSRHRVETIEILPTPARVLALLTLAAALLLAGSQFADYRGVAIGADQYVGVEGVAPAPEVDRERAGEAHLWLLLPAAALAIVALGPALRGRWRLCRLIAAVGIAAIVVSLAVDMPAGLDAGSVARDFEGAEARLLAGFWVQLLAATLLAASSLLLGRQLRPDPSGASSASRPGAPGGQQTPGGASGPLRRLRRLTSLGRRPSGTGRSIPGNSSGSALRVAGDGAPPVGGRALGPEERSGS